MERGALKGHGALLLANVIWGLNSPICKTVLLSPENPEGLNHFYNPQIQMFDGF